MKNLPIHRYLPRITEALHAGNLVLSAAPGAGKSTIVPIELVKEPWLAGKKILMLQPRRVAAIAVARRMARLTDTRPGGLIGHQVRFSRQISPETRIEVLTEGILTRRIQNDPFLENVGLIIFDEFHERSIHADLCLALCREIQKDIRPDLKIMAMSATINSANLARFLGNCPIVEAEGFLHPVEINYGMINAGRDRFLAMAEFSRKIIRESCADESYLVFLPGAGEISLFREILEDVQSHEICCLHGSLSIEDQEKILQPPAGPRIVLTTNLAETSLTIEGITTVIDSGFCRKLKVNPSTGLETLELQRISKASAAQRAGRAGRLQPGRAFRLWTLPENEALPDFDQPEILRLDLATTVLELAGWGVADPSAFAWFQAPEDSQLTSAQQLLYQLQAIDSDGSITPLGRSMLDLPLHPRLARMLISGEQHGIARLAALAAAVISERDFMRFEPGKNDPDLMLRIEQLQAGKCSFPADKRQFERVCRVAEQLQGLIKSGNGRVRPLNANQTLARVILSAFPDRLCQLRNENDKSAYKICSGQGFSLAGGAGDRYIIALELDARLRKGRNDGQIFLYVAINETMLAEMLGHLCENTREIFFCERRQAILVRKVTRYLELVLAEREERIQPQERNLAEKMLIGHVFANLNEALALNDPAFRQFSSRLRLINEIDPEFKLIDKDWFRENVESICAGVTSFAELHKLDLAQVYFSTKPYDLKQKFEKMVPERIEVPSGRLVEIEYPDSGSPYISVKIQEMFGQKETPCICNGKVKLVVHLLSPARRPVQITSDLASFWANGYKTVVAELKGRYPKHPWPDDPAAGIAFSGTKKQLEKKLLPVGNKSQMRR